MLAQSLIALVVAAAGSAAFDGELLRRQALDARDTPASATPAFDPGCSTALSQLASLVTGLPSPTGDLSSYLVTAARTLTDPCSLSVPASVADAFTSYESQVVSFYAAHSSQLNSALAACPSLTSLVGNPVCSTSQPVVVVTSASTASMLVTTSLPVSVSTGTSTVVIGTTTSTSSGDSSVSVPTVSGSTNPIPGIITTISGTATTVSGTASPSSSPGIITTISGANAGPRNAGLAIAAGLAGAVAMAL